MRHITFAWTTPALLAGRKTVTRREWTEEYAQGFQAGDLVTAYSRSPRAGGKPVATIRLVRNPYVETRPPKTDWEAEGFAYLTEIGATVNGWTPAALWKEWRKRGTSHLWVVRFELMQVFDVAPAGASTLAPEVGPSPGGCSGRVGA